MKEKEIHLNIPQPHPAQQQILSEAKRFNIVACGRRWGKTELGKIVCIQPFLDGYPIGWYAPSQDSFEKTFDEFMELLAPLKPQGNKITRTIQIPRCKGVINFWTLSGEHAKSSSRGRAYKVVVVDEAAHTPNLQDIFPAVIFPTLADYKGTAWLLSTPNGENFFKVLFDKGQDPYYPDWMSWQMPSSTSPYVSREEIELQTSLLTEATFKQEWLAEFNPPDTAVFKNVRLCAKAVKQELPFPDHEYYCGIDFAKVQDYSVFTIIDGTTMEVVSMHRMRDRSYNSQKNLLVGLHEMWNFKKMLAESNAMGVPVLEELMLKNLPIEGFNMNGMSKPRLIEELVLAFEQEKIAILDDPIVIAELEAFEAKVTAHGNTIYNAPKGGHDDTVISLALAYHAAKPRKKKYTLEEKIKMFDRSQLRI